ncbi:MAG: hypothetical protein PHE43_00385 [Candidatus Nanoarchaeia archaeon]|nr:hypothetical protein [Candidatus Nanoarchaeia archaeon]
MKREVLIVLLTLAIIIFIPELVSAPGVKICGTDYACGTSDGVCPRTYGASCPTSGSTTLGCDPDCTDSSCSEVIECVPACSAGYTCKAGNCVATTCSCTSWVNKGCGGLSCSDCNRMAQSRTCTPAGCALETQCKLNVAACIGCSCTSWKSQTCGGGTCALTEMYQTRTSTPKTCASTSRCIADASCAAAIECEILSATWKNNGNEEITNAESNENVYLTFTTNDGCLGKPVNIKIYEKDTPPNSDDFLDEINLTSLDSKTKSIAWVTKKNDLIGDSEYYFIVSINPVFISTDLIVSRIESTDECDDGNIDLDETCESCPADAGCLADERCLIDNTYADEKGCVNCIDNPDECVAAEDCIDGCYPGLICYNSKYCACNEETDSECYLGSGCEDTDPDCCEILDVYFNPLCSAGVGALGNGVDMVVEGSDSCIGQTANLEVFAYKTDDSLEPVNLETSEAEFDEEAVVLVSTTFEYNQDENYVFSEGLFSSEEYNKYLLNATVGSVSETSDDLIIMPCNLAIDSDCDGINDNEDECPESDYCSDTSGDGCTKSDSSCLVYWNCENAPWSECKEDGYLYRDIELCTYTESGDPITDAYCNSQEVKEKLLSSKRCIEETPFPVFSWINIVSVILLLTIFYVFKKR